MGVYWCNTDEKAFKYFPNVRVLCHKMHRMELNSFYLDTIKGS